MSALKNFPLILLFLLLAACTANPALDSSPTPSLPAVTETPSPPTATPVPMAFLVNGEGLPLEEFQAELARYRQAQAALGREVSDEQARQAVRDDLVAQMLLAQAARAQGFSLDEAALQTRLDALAASLGGPQALSEWQAAHGYDDPGFRAALKRSAEAAWMRDQILAAVPASAEQVHIRQILTYNQEDAERALARLNAGEDFDQLAARYDPTLRGDIGWFPRGYLSLKAIEDAAFALEVNAVSPIIQSDVGFHILKLIERDPSRPLAFDALLALQARALKEWVAARRAESAIEILVP
jgi:parvulin-like peptidyl-prolyl isomerase